MTTPNQKLKHPSVLYLAQFASGDLGWPQRHFVGRHLNYCGGCARYVDGLRAADEELRREARSQTLTAFEAIADFDSLEKEMLGNIAVGLAAARCVDGAERKRPWRGLGWVAAGLSTLFVAGWWTHVPSEETHAIVSKIERWASGERPLMRDASTVMKSLPEGIVVRSQGSALTMRHPRSAIVSVAGGGTMEARYVDDETGQVTISSVYGQ